MIKKKGSHVGVVLSFVIFVTFLVFLYSVIEPVIKVQKDKQPVLEKVNEKLLKIFSANVTKINLVMDSAVTGSCAQITLDSFVHDNLKISDRAGNEINYFKSGNSLSLEVKDTSNKIYKIYGSDDFPSAQTSMSGCSAIGYNINLKKSEGIILASKISNLVNDINSGEYGSFKNLVELPSGREVGFSFEYSNNTIISTNDAETSTSIYSEESLIQYIGEDAEIKSGILVVKIW